MISTVEMAKLLLAGPRQNLDGVLRLCGNLENIHISDYSSETDGMKVGTPHPNANEISTILSKTRSCIASLKPVNKSGKVSRKEIEKSLSINANSDSETNLPSQDSAFIQSLEEVIMLIENVRACESEIVKLEEQILALKKVAPLGMSLELLTGVKAIEIFVAEISKPSKVKAAFSEIRSDIELLTSEGILAVACESKHSAEVQIILGELGTKPVQIPSGEGKPSKMLESSSTKLAKTIAAMETAQKSMEEWSNKHGRMLLAVNEYLEREEAILTGHVKCAVSEHAFALEAWFPAKSSDLMKSKFKKLVSHVSVEAYVDDHHHHGDHHDEEKPPIEYDNMSPGKPFESLTDLVGRPAYNTVDPTLMVMITFPILYGMILGDAGYGFILFCLAMLLRAKIGHTPFGKTASTILTWMAIWTMIWGLLYAEIFGFIVEDWTIFAGFYDWTYEMTYAFKKSSLGKTLGLGHTYIPFHRADGALMDYVLFSIYFGTAHLALGFLIGFINVFRAHGFLPAFFEKGSWMMILFGGFGHCFRFITDEKYELFTLSTWSAVVIAGIGCLIIGLAVFEKLGWAGGFIMGPIETFGLLANTLSYMRIMAVGVAGVMIAHLANEKGYHMMIEATNPLLMVAFFLLWIAVHLFALALGILSPSIHAVRLHFVEWMSKFHDGSGERFSPFGGRSQHVEVHKS